MKAILDILRICRQKGVSIALDPAGENLKVKGNIKDLTPEEKQRIQENKQGIIGLLKQAVEQQYENIPAAPEQPHYPLSSVQKRLWALSQFEVSNVAYNLPGACVFKGPLDTDRLRTAFDLLIDRHEILRTVFREDESGQISQFILPPGESGFRIMSIDLQGEDDPEAAARNRIRRDFMQPFDLAAGPLLRACLYQLNSSEWIFAYVLHHIISDGWSMDVLLQDMLRFYAADHQHPLPVQYKDYAVWEQQQLDNGALKEQAAYWLQQFAGELPVPELPGDKTRPVIKSYAGGMIQREMDASLSRNFPTLCRKQDATLFMGLVALVNTLLYHYTQQEDIIVGCPVTGRAHADLHQQLGCYVNTLPLRTRFKGDQDFMSLLEQVRAVTLGAFAHQQYPFDELYEALQPERGRSPLFEAMVALENSDSNPTGAGIQVKDLAIHPYTPDISPVSKFDLSFYFVETGDKIKINLQYNSDVYTEKMASVLCDHLIQLASAITVGPSVTLQQLDFLSTAEKHRQITAFNEHTASWQDDATAVELFATQVNKTPDNIALVFGTTDVSYQALDERSNQLASRLLSHHQLQTGEPVAVKLPRSEWSIIALLAVLKSGGVYLPVHPDHPQERIDYMLENSRCRVMIDEQEIARFLNEKQLYSTDAPVKKAGPADPAYIIYTSGSTGKPKGVLVGHDNLSSFLISCQHNFQVNTPVSMPLLASGVFDISLFEIFLPLLSGGTLILPEDAAVNNSLLLAGYLEKSNAFHAVPALMAQITDHIRTTGTQERYQGIRDLFTGGDEVPTTVLKEMQEVFPQARIHVLYGPTECTVFVTTRQYAGKAANIRKGTIIGHPAPNACIYVLGSSLQLLPAGVSGEICIGGQGVAKGYLNNPELTAEKFVPDPFREGARIYRTGDLGKWLPDGNLEFIGRKDTQLKIRGFRIEAGEVEYAICSHENIQAAVVTAWRLRSGEKELTAYFTSKAPTDIAALRTHLSRLLPAYMVPRFFIQLEALPLNSNGKLDKKRLPDPEGMAQTARPAYIAPRNETEEKMVQIWHSILSTEKIGVRDNFFELGGHSIKVAQLISRIDNVYRVRLNIQELFTEPTIENICTQISFILDQQKQQQKKSALIKINI